MIRLMGLLTDKERWANYLQFRPQVRPGNARADDGAKAATIVAWWKYALRGVLHDVRKSRPAGTDRAGLWKLASELILARSRYVKLYKRRTQLTGREFAAELATMKGSVSDDEMRQLEELEDKIPVSNVLFFRAIAHAELVAEKKSSKVALRAYKASKDKAMGGGLSRLVSKAIKSEEEYQSMKPQKPEWTGVSKEQRADVYKSMGLLSTDGEEGSETGAQPHEVKSVMEVTISGAIWLAASPTDRPGARSDRAVECGLLRIDLDGVHWRAQKREASKTTEINIKSMRFADW